MCRRSTASSCRGTSTLAKRCRELPDPDAFLIAED